MSYALVTFEIDDIFNVFFSNILLNLSVNQEYCGLIFILCDVPYIFNP